MSKENTHLDQYKDIAKTILIQGSFAAAVGPLATPLQNVIVHLSIQPNDKYSEVIKAVFTQKDKALPAFNGVMPFTARMAASSAMGYTGTDKVASKLFSSVPEQLQPILAGIVMGLAESVVTGKAEQAELNVMTGGKISYGKVIMGAAPRNAFGWIAGEKAMRLCNEHSCSPMESMGLGFAAGALAGMASMPIQQALAMTASNQGNLTENLFTVLRLGLPALRGGGFRAGILALYTSVGALANWQLNGCPAQEASQGKGRSVG